MTYGVGVKSVLKGGKVIRSILMLDSHDRNCFVILLRSNSYWKKTIRVPTINQISLDVDRGNFQNLVTEEKKNIVSLFLTAESIDFIFSEKNDLDSFLYVLHETLLCSHR